MTKKDANQIEIFLETGKTYVVAAALDWPGWSRRGRDEAAALQALCDYAPRYARALEKTRLGFRAPADTSTMVVVERMEGGVTTDMGIPGKPLPRDNDPLDAAELERLTAALQACWQAFDTAVKSAAGKTLTKGPRGGGRELEKIFEHVLGAGESYLSAMGGSLEKAKGEDPNQAIARLREAVLATLPISARGEIPERGPRGGLRWPARYFIRRMAWHDLDHAWEIEDRAGLA